MRAEMRRWRGEVAHRRSGPEPEVIKKGKKEEEGEAGAESRRRSSRASCFWVRLGNPGEEYDTPHNAGFMVVDRLAEMYESA